MLAQCPAWSLAEGRETCRAFTRLFVSHARLVYLVGTLDDRRLICGLFAAAHAISRGGPPPGFAATGAGAARAAKSTGGRTAGTG